MKKLLLLIVIQIAFCTAQNDPCSGITEDIFISHETECNSYYHCKNGVGTLGQCPDNLHFDPDLQMCRYPGSFNCSLNNVLTCSEEGVTFHPHPSSCKHYYLCTQGNIPVLKECVDGTHWSQPLNQCAPIDVANCTSEEIITCPDEPGFTYLPSTVNCDRYFICFEGNPHQFDCYPGLYWNANINECDFAENVNCELKSKSMALMKNNDVTIKNKFTSAIIRIK